MNKEVNKKIKKDVKKQVNIKSNNKTYQLRDFYTLEHSEFVAAWKQHDCICTYIMAVSEDRFFAEHSSTHHMLLCTICAYEYIGRSSDGQVRQKEHNDYM